MGKNFDVKLKDVNDNYLYPLAHKDDSGAIIKDTYLNKSNGDYLQTVKIDENGRLVIKPNNKEAVEFKGGDPSYKILLSDDYTSLPCDAEGTLSATFPDDYQFMVVSYLGSNPINIDKVTNDSFKILTKGVTLFYELTGITLRNDPIIIEYGEDKIKVVEVKPYQLNLLEGKINFSLYIDGKFVYNNIYKAVLNIKGAPGQYFSISVPQIINRDSSGIIKDFTYTATLYKSTGSSSNRDSYPGYWKLTIYKESGNTIKYWYTDGWKTESTSPIETHNVTIKKNDIEEETEKLSLEVFSNISMGVEYLIDREYIDVISDGEKGSQGEQGPKGDNGNSSKSQTIYAVGSTYPAGAPELPTTPVIDDSSPDWKITKPDCSIKYPLIYSCVQSYQVDKDNKFIEGTLNFSKPELIEAYKNDDVNPVEYATFLKLTNGGTQKGIYYGGTDNSKLYINGSYIKADSIEGSKILGGTLRLGVSGTNPGDLKIYDGKGTEESNLIGKWDKDGILAKTGTISGSDIVIGPNSGKDGKLTLIDSNSNKVGFWDKNGLEINNYSEYKDVNKKYISLNKDSNSNYLLPIYLQQYYIIPSGSESEFESLKTLYNNFKDIGVQFTTTDPPESYSSEWITDFRKEIVEVYDLNNDGKITSRDAVLCSQSLVTIENHELYKDPTLETYGLNIQTTSIKNNNFLNASRYIITKDTNGNILKYVNIVNTNVTPYGITNNIIIKDIDDNFKGRELRPKLYDLIWQNTAAATFPAQTLNLPIDNYDFIIIEGTVAWTHGTFTTTIPKSFLSLPNKPFEIYLSAPGRFNDTNVDYLYERLVKISSNSLSFSSGYYINLSTRSTTSTDDRIIPRLIYGVKLGE